MKLSYGSLIGRSPVPVEIQGRVVGHIEIPRLKDIDAIGMKNFEVYEYFISVSPKDLMTTVIKGGKDIWKQLQRENKDKDVTLFDTIVLDRSLIQFYLEIMDFFFVEPVVFAKGRFFVLSHDVDASKGIKESDVLGILDQTGLKTAIQVMRCVCCINKHSEKDNDEPVKFKSKIAEEIYNKIHSEDDEEIKKPQETPNKNLTLANIISVVANFHCSLNYTNIYELTIPQLYDAFQRMQRYEMYDLQKRQVSVWGDEKNKFDPTVWYHNFQD